MDPVVDGSDVHASAAYESSHEPNDMLSNLWGTAVDGSSIQIAVDENLKSLPASGYPDLSLGALLHTGNAEAGDGISNSSSIDELFGNMTASSTSVPFTSVAVEGVSLKSSDMDDLFGDIPASFAPALPISRIEGEFGADISATSANTVDASVTKHEESESTFKSSEDRDVSGEAPVHGTFMSQVAFVSNAATGFAASEGFGSNASTGFAASEGFGSDAVTGFASSEGSGSDAATGLASSEGFGSDAATGFAASEGFGSDAVSESSSQGVAKVPFVPQLKLSLMSSTQPEDTQLRTRETPSFLPTSSVSSPIKASRQDDFDSDSGDEAAKKPKFKFVIKNSSEISAAAAAAPLVAPIVLAPTPALSDGVQSRSRDRRAATEESSDQSAAIETASTDHTPIAKGKRQSVHNPAIDAQIKQYSKSQGISAAVVNIPEGLVDANQFRDLEAQLIELKLSWALVNAENDTLRKSCRDLRRELEQANLRNENWESKLSFQAEEFLKEREQRDGEVKSWEKEKKRWKLFKTELETEVGNTKLKMAELEEELKALKQRK